MTKWIVTTALTVLVVVAYTVARAIFLDQSTSYTVATSNITVNYVLALYVYGAAMDKVAKRVGKRTGWILYALGLVAILLVLKYVFGWTSRW